MRSKNVLATSSPLCSVDGCDRRRSAREWCGKHYQRWRTHGDPVLVLRDRDQPERCTVEGCSNKPRSKGLCNAHYKQSRPPSVGNRTDRVAFFWANVQQDDAGCWIWQRKPTNSGYGQMRGFAGQISSHRFAYELLVGPVPDGLQLDHLCEVRICCNPGHLEPVPGVVNRMRGDTSRPNNGGRR